MTINSITYSLIPKLSENSLKGAGTCLFDSEKRITYNKSLWRSIFHRKEKQQLNAKTWEAVSSFFQERYQINDPLHFKRIWKETGEKQWSVKSPLTANRLSAIDEVFRNKLAYHGNGISQREPETQENSAAVAEVVRALLHGGSLTTNLIQKPLMQAALMKENPSFLTKFRKELQLELDHLSKETPKTEAEILLWRQFLGSILSFLPFGYPKNKEILNIPYLDNNGTCHTAEYKVKVIELNPLCGSTPITAIGLSPTNDQTAPPILAFIGTTFPAGRGFAATVMADFTPAMSVGEEAYKQGKEQIQKWIGNQTNVHVIGASLGGALALHTLIDNPNHLSRVDTYNPPGLYPQCWKDKSFDTGCEVYIYTQAGDIVSKMGFWPTGEKVKLFNLIPHQKGISEGMPMSHTRVFSGCKKVTFLRKDPKEQNLSIPRKALTFLHRFLGPLLVYYPTCFLLRCYRITLAAERCWNNLWKKPVKNGF